jgi:glycosyltransferase involved in cell wall biosynthesis
MAPTARQIESLRELGIEIHVVTMTGIPRLKYLQAIPKVRSMARRVDLVHAHYCFCGWLALMQWAKPVVISFMGDDLLGTPNEKGELEWFSQRLVRVNRVVARFVDAVIVKSREMADVVAPVAAHVIPNGVDTRVFRPRDKQAARKELDFDDQRKLVLFPGNPDNPRKGHSLAAAAVRQAMEIMREDIQLIPLWGVPPDRVATYMTACDAMLMTSHIEGSPNVVKEAMACDLPVVAVPVGDVVGLLENVAGYSICPRHPERLARELVVALKEPKNVAGRQAIFDKSLDLESVARRVHSVYQQVLSGEREPRRQVFQRHDHRATEVCQSEFTVS